MSGANGVNGIGAALDFTFSMVRSAGDTTPRDYSFRQLMADIRGGTWQTPVARVRQSYRSALDAATTAGLSPHDIVEKAKEAAKPFKLQLPGALISGVFTKRQDDGLRERTPAICCDLDHLPNVERTRELIVADRHVLACFISPTGTGLKIIFRIDPSKPHAECYRAAEHHVREHFGEDIDPSCRNVSRLCFCSHDPDAFVADHAEALPDAVSEFDRLVQTWGEAGFFTTDEKSGAKSFRGLNQPHWAARLMLTQDGLFEPSENEFYVYVTERGLWMQKSRATLKTALAADLRGWGVKNSVEASVVQRLSDRLLADILRQSEGTAEAQGVFSRPRTLVHCANGMVDLTATEPILLPFNREHFSRNQTPVAWLPGAECPRFMGQLLGAALDADDVGILQRWIGSVLLGGNRAQRIMLLTGTAGGGKGTLMEIIEAVVGPDNVGQLRTELLAERFELGRLVGRTLLCGKDVNANFLQEKGANVIKALVGHDLLTGERKGGNTAINFRGEFAVAITANTKLRVRLQGDDDAWRRRLISIIYSQPKPARRIENFARLLLAEEGPGILRWAVEGAFLHLRELEEFGDFQLTPAQKKRVDALLSESDSLRRFAEEHLIADNDTDTTVSEIVEAYVEFCDRMGWTPLTENAVQRALPDLVLDMFGTSRRQDIKRFGRSHRGFKGVAVVKEGKSHAA